MNQLICCTKCQHVDMADLAASEAVAARKTPTPFICTRCLTGKWHNQFAYVRYNPDTDRVSNPPLPTPTP